MLHLVLKKKEKKIKALNEMKNPIKFKWVAENEKSENQIFKNFRFNCLKKSRPKKEKM